MIITYILAGILIGLLILWIINIQLESSRNSKKIDEIDIYLVIKKVYELSQFDTDRVKHLLEDRHDFITFSNLQNLNNELEKRIQKIENKLYEKG